MTKKKSRLSLDLLFLNCLKDALLLENETKFEACKNVGTEPKV